MTGGKRPRLDRRTLRKLAAVGPGRVVLPPHRIRRYMGRLAYHATCRCGWAYSSPERAERDAQADQHTGST